MGTERAAFREAIDELEHALDRTIEMERRMQVRIIELREAETQGRQLRDIVSREQPLIVQMLTETVALLDGYGSRVRRAEARALHHEGLTMDEIALLFGVTRQRISALLRDSDEPHGHCSGPNPANPPA